MLNMDYDSYVEKEFLSEILKMLYISHTQFTGSYFLEFLSLAQSIKTLIHQRMEWQVEKIDTEEELMDHSDTIMNASYSKSDAISK